MEVTKTTDHVTHAVIGGQQTMDLGVSNTAEFLHMLTATLYSNQKLAVVRETLCNAWDAHIDAGITDRPIQIELDREKLVIRDFGKGIPHDLILPIYGIYGESTKKGDGKQTGGFGLGCKAPLAYTDHFEVVSCNGGWKTVYRMSKSSAERGGKPGITPIVRVPSSDTGITVTIPIQAPDMPTFREMIERIVRNGEMLATLNGALLPVIEFSKAVHGYYLTSTPLMGPEATRNKYGVTIRAHQILIRYGNVIYPLSNHEDTNQLVKSVCEFLAQLNINALTLVLQAPPNSIAVTPSRETLSMQEHTIKTVKRLMQQFLASTKDVDMEVLAQAKLLLDNTIEVRDYAQLFSRTWPFATPARPTDHLGVTDLAGLAHNIIGNGYPRGTSYHLQDINERLDKAVAAGMLDRGLVASYRPQLARVETKPHGNTHKGESGWSDWLQRRILGRAAVRLQEAGYPFSALYLRDVDGPNLYQQTCSLYPASHVRVRHHLQNLPFLRKRAIVSSGLNNLDARLGWYANKHNRDDWPQALVVHVRSRKTGSADAAIAVLEKMGYEVLDLSRRREWEPEPVKVTVKPGEKRPKPTTALPALSYALSRGDDIDLSRIKAEKTVKLDNPEFYLHIPTTQLAGYQLQGCSFSGTQLLIKQFGHRIGVAKNDTELKRMVKFKVPDFRTHFEELALTTLAKPAVKQYLAFDYTRVKDKNYYIRNDEMIKLVYELPCLREFFGLPDDLTEEDHLVLRLIQKCGSVLLTSSVVAEWNRLDSVIRIARKNTQVIERVTRNDLLKLIDPHRLREGLEGPKRQVYLDILFTALKN